MGTVIEAKAETATKAKVKLNFNTAEDLATEVSALRSRVYAATTSVPTASTDAAPIGVGAILVDTEAKKVYVVTDVAENGDITKVQCGSWT